MMKKIIVLCIVCCSVKGYGQFTVDYLKSADSYFAKGDYYSAAQYYEKHLALGKGKGSAAAAFNPYTIQTKSSKTSVGVLSSKEQAVYNVAESYRLLHFPAKAAPAYKQIVESSNEKFPLAKFHYGNTLRALEQFDEAQNQLQQFLNTYTNTDTYKAAAEKELKNLAFIQQQLAKKDIALYKINKLGGGDVSNGANYASTFNNDKIFFTSTRTNNDATTKNVNNIYEATLENNTIANSAKIAISALGAEEHQGVVTINNDASRMYFTKWNAKNGMKNAHIYTTTKVDGIWTTPIKVEGLNEEGANTQQPFLTLNGTLLFSSNRGGGFGGYDLYQATIVNGTASNIMNLGKEINTAGDEQAAMVHLPTNTLIFSTNGRVGMGGFDLYTTKINGASYTEPINMGYPINSVKDDLYFSTNSNSKNIVENAYISSDRAADCCLELYSVSKDRVPKKISGLVISCDNKTPVANATVKVVASDNTVITTQTTDAMGKYSFTIDEFMSLKATASSTGLVDGNLDIAIPTVEVDAINNPDICLEKVFPPPPGEEVVLDNIYFEYDKYTLLEETNPTLDKLAKNMLQHPEVVIEIAGHTDSNGEDDYNQRLSQKRAESCVKYLISKGVEAKRLVAKGYGEIKPLAPNTNDDGSDNEEGRAKNRRTEFKVIK